MNFDELIIIREKIDQTIKLFETSGNQNVGKISNNIRDIEIGLRRSRNDLFPSGYFSDVAWDILIELDSAERRGVRFFVTDACIETRIPLTTALRYIIKLEKDGYVNRHPDAVDRRRSCVSLTSLAKDSLDQVFGGVAQLVKDMDAREYNS